MMRNHVLGVFAFIAGAVVSAAADEVASPSAAPNEQASLQSYAAAAPRCLEWSDGCSVCLRDGGAVHCSMPGIACQAGPIFCRREGDK
jgi:hypothetical protein